MTGPVTLWRQWRYRKQIAAVKARLVPRVALLEDFVWPENGFTICVGAWTSATWTDNKGTKIISAENVDGTIVVQFEAGRTRWCGAR